MVVSPSSSALPPSVNVLGGHETVSVDCAIDRILRSSSSSSSSSSPSSPSLEDDAARLLSTVLGRHVSVADVRDRCERVRAARRKLDALLLSPGVVQRTPEWYAARMTMLTASDIAQALGCAKFGTRKQFFEKKCAPPESQRPFDATLPPLRWGIMFEPVACALYSCMNAGVRVHEFGLLRHPTVAHLGASPDGITEDGVMVEIKCPWRRKISPGDVPLQYYYQIQGQLEVCGLEECDYFECEFQTECLESLQGNPDLPPTHRGVFLEVRHTDGRAPSYVYPADCVGGADIGTLSTWCAQAREAEVERMGGQGVDVCPQWWSLVRASTVRVRRDPAFVREMLERVSEAWTCVERYRADPQAFAAEVIQATPSKRASPSSASSKRPAATASATSSATASRLQDASLMQTYAFVEEDEEEEES